MTNNQLQKGEIIIYRSKDGKAELEVNIQGDTLWLPLNKIAELFGSSKQNISYHMNNIYKSGELSKKSTVKEILTVQKEGKREIERNIEYYNLDTIISVGYRVNSKNATQFRIWATSILKDYLLKGYSLNRECLYEKSLNEFEEAVGLIKKTIASKALTSDESKGLLDIITSYSSTWVLLQKYDQGELGDSKTKKAHKRLDYDYCRSAIDDLYKSLIKKNEATDIFGCERNEHFKGIVELIYQTFDKQDLYPSIEEKAAHLLYFIIKDHPFVDGNKRIGAFLFIVFLAKNNHLLRKTGEKKINDNALVALALLIAESSPKQKQIMIQLVVHFLSNK